MIAGFESQSHRQIWYYSSSVRILPCHGSEPGSIPGSTAKYVSVAERLKAADCKSVIPHGGSNPSTHTIKHPAAVVTVIRFGYSSCGGSFNWGIAKWLRHRSLISAFSGSNPDTPSKFQSVTVSPTVGCANRAIAANVLEVNPYKVRILALNQSPSNQSNNHVPRSY